MYVRIVISTQFLLIIRQLDSSIVFEIESETFPSTYYLLSHQACRVYNKSDKSYRAFYNLANACIRKFAEHDPTRLSETEWSQAAANRHENRTRDLMAAVGAEGEMMKLDMMYQIEHVVDENLLSLYHKRIIPDVDGKYIAEADAEEGP